MENNYLPVFLQIVVAIGFSAAALIASVVLGKSGRRSAIKDSPYECGMVPVGGPPPRFAVKFYLVAMLFILFDLEVVFMYQWAVFYRDFIALHGANGATVIFCSMFAFVAVITVGYVYAIKKGVLDWKR